MAKMLFEYGADPDLTVCRDYSYLFMMAFFYKYGYKNKNMLIKMLIDHGADVNRTGYDNMTPLVAAVKRGREISLIKLLLKAGADVNIRDDNGFTALWYAVTLDKPEIVKLLLEFGADVSKKYENDQTVLDYAIKNKKEKIAEYIFKKYPNSNSKKNS